jgi:uncharacterized membrane protein
MIVALCIIGYLVVGFVVAVAVEVNNKDSPVSFLAGLFWPVVTLVFIVAAVMASAVSLVEKTAELVKRLVSGKTDKGPVNLRKSS